jgi:hypothetical protein
VVDSILAPYRQLRDCVDVAQLVRAMNSLAVVVVLGLAIGAQSGGDRASSPPTQTVAPAATPLERALAAARVSGKPVLVIVVSPSTAVRTCRSRWLSDWLVVGGQRFLAELALVEMAFATRDQLQDALPRRRHAGAERGEIGLLDALDGECDWTPLESPEGSWCASSGGSDTNGAYRKSVETLVALLSARLAAGDESTQRRASVARRGLSPRELAEVEASLLDPTHTPRPLVDRCAWMYRWSLQSKRRTGLGQFEQALAAAAGLRLLHQPPHGARWAAFTRTQQEVRYLSSDGAEDQALLEHRASLLRAPVLSPDPSGPPRPLACSLGPCGTGFTSASSFVFLDEYTRVLVDATDLD